MVISREALFKTGDIIEGRYRIHKVLGEGGMGTVFLAEHTLIKRRVAIKILHPELATDSDVIERFMNEARAAGMLGHPNIVESTDMGFTGNNIPYIVFEYLEGTLLTDEIYRVGGLPIRRAMKIVAQIASALHAAHNAGIVHRDLKSDNIFLTDKEDSLDHVKVLDFGISRFIATEGEVSTVMGTPEFMAPEQITDPSMVDCRADIYALGVILYEMLEARRPFTSGDDPRALMERIVRDPPPAMQRKEVPHGLVHIIHDRLLAKDPADRFQSMVDVVAALEQFTTKDHTPLPRKLDDLARSSTTIPRPVQTLHTPWPAPRAASSPGVTGAKRPVALYAMAAAGVAIGGVGLGFGLRGGGNNEPAQPVAIQQPTPAPAASIPAPAPAPEVKKVAVTIDADAAGARFVFRRRLQPVGAVMELTPSDVVELVEVSAPNYKTVRYWLTFDRETHLRAHLEKGTGSTEATEEQTLVALGELTSRPATEVAAKPAVAIVAAPAAAAVIAKTGELNKPTQHTIEHAMTSPTKDNTTEARLAPRKIGRAADTPEPLSVETSAAKPENVQVVADVAAPAQPVIAPPPAPPTSEPAPVVPPPPAKPEVTSPAPVTSPTPAVATVKPNASPAIVSPKVVRKVSGDAPQITLDHYDGDDLPATITAKLCIDTTGHVTSATMIGKVAQSRLGDEIAATLHTWVYAPYSRDGTAAPVCFPVALRTR